jgi:hypothetical protein
MAQEHNVSPLPKGRYWITVLDSPEGQLADFDEWLRDVKGSVSVESSELDQDSKPKSEFIIFNVTGPGAFLAAEKFGFPNKAPANIKNRDDAEQAPKVDEPGIAEALQFAKTAGKVAVGLVLLKLGIELFRKRG